MEIIVAALWGGAVVAASFQTYKKHKEKEIVRLLAPKIETLIDLSSQRISKQQRKLKRALTDEEKNKIADECYKLV